LASSTKKREGKARSSLGLLLDLIIGLFSVFIVIVGIAVLSPGVFHHGRRKRRVDCGLKVLKTHRSAYFKLVVLQVRKPLTHLLMRLSEKGVVGAAHGDESLEALEKDALFLAPMSSNSGGLRSRRGCMSTSRRNMCTGRRSSRRRRDMWSPDKLWHISTMVPIILKIHVRLGVEDLLDVR
jgi:hypothetical protein